MKPQMGTDRKSVNVEVNKITGKIILR